MPSVAARPERLGQRSRGRPASTFRKLQRWNTRAHRAASVPVLRPVEVLPEPEPSDGLALIALSGVRIEGLGVEQAAHLLRLLA